VSAPVRHLVVYGTLRSDAPVTPAGRPDLSGRVRSLGVVHLAGSLHDAGLYPLLVRPREHDAVREVAAELLEIVDPGIIAVLDDYEKLDVQSPEASEYTRIVVHVPEHGVAAWLYCAGRDAAHLPLIASGDWLNR